MRRRPVLVICIAAAACLIAAAWRAFDVSDANTLAPAREALAARDFDRAESLALEVAAQEDADAWAWMVAGEAAARAGRFEDGLAHYEHVTTGAAQLRASAAHGRGEMCLHLGRLERAEHEFRRALEIDPGFLPPRRRLVELLNLSGRTHESIPWLEPLIQSPMVTLEDLFHAGDPDHALSQTESAWEDAGQDDADPLLLLGLAHEALAANRIAEARRVFERVLAARPENLPAHAGRGQVLLESSPEELSEWRRRLPAGADQNPAVIAVLGQIADLDGRREDAVRLHAHLVSQRPTSRTAWHRFGLSLGRAQRTADAELALERAQQLQTLAIWLDDLFSHRENAGLIRRVAEQLAMLGRGAEASAWARYAVSVGPRQDWAAQLLAQLQQEPQSLVNAEQASALASLVTGAAGRATPVETADSVPSRIESPVVRSADIGDRIQFIDSAAETGLEFVHWSARDDSSRGARIIETTGGGVGVLDFDADNWPDLYFTQGGRTFPMTAADHDGDRLYRNRSGTAWSDVTSTACLTDEGFGQGIAAGDFNNDGFTDLYVANYGVNRLFQNQGDGTFLDVTPATMARQPVWTSSCAIADLNGDGNPDLFDATYCRGADVESRLCADAAGPRSCSPRAFAAETDRLWLSSGNGEWTRDADQGLNVPDGYGLGLLVFRSQSQAPLSVFVANDEVPNHWFVREQGAGGSRAPWSNRALVAGLAADANGQSQACMGIACDDIDGNGWPDLFVTNFIRESNTLYRGIAVGVFEDATRDAGLRDPGWDMLGFGTQFVDADLDGWPDLFVANGHIDDLTAAGEKFAMRPQCFRNVGGRFDELSAEQAGACFGREGLGRGMARIDWNGDGREDVVIVNQQSPAALLTNVSVAGKPLALQLRGTQCARDAIGTIVQLEAAGRTITRQITAGDGYQASNQRQLIIGGLGGESVDIVVDWPSGEQQRFTGLRSSSQYLLIQGRPDAVLLKSW